MSTQPESKLSLKIKNACLRRGAFMWKVHGNEFTPAGLPDLVGAYRGQFIAIETKMVGEKLSPIQEYRIERMQAAGALILAPCFTVVRAIEFLNDLDMHLEKRPIKDKPAQYIYMTYGRGWSPLREG